MVKFGTEAAVWFQVLNDNVPQGLHEFMSQTLRKSVCVLGGNLNDLESGFKDEAFLIALF